MQNNEVGDGAYGGQQEDWDIAKTVGPDVAKAPDNSTDYIDAVSFSGSLGWPTLGYLFI